MFPNSVIPRTKYIICVRRCYRRSHRRGAILSPPVCIRIAFLFGVKRILSVIFCIRENLFILYRTPRTFHWNVVVFNADVKSRVKYNSRDAIRADVYNFLFVSRGARSDREITQFARCKSDILRSFRRKEKARYAMRSFLSFFFSYVFTEFKS